MVRKVFPVENRTNEHHHEILHIWVILGTKSQLKLIIVSFWTKFTKKKYFQSKTEQAVEGLQAFVFYVVNVNLTVVYKHYEDLEDLIILNILKEKLVMFCLLYSFYLNIMQSFSNSTVQKAMIKFRFRFQFQIHLRFYRTVEKVQSCDGNGQKLGQGPPFFHLSHFGYDFVFSWLRFKHTEYKVTLT